MHSSGIMHLQYSILVLAPGLVLTLLRLLLEPGLGLVIGLARLQVSGLVQLSGPLL